MLATCRQPVCQSATRCRYPGTNLSANQRRVVDKPLGNLSSNQRDDVDNLSVTSQPISVAMSATCGYKRR